MRRTLFIDASVDPKITKSRNSKQATGFNGGILFASRFRWQPIETKRRIVIIAERMQPGDESAGPSRRKKWEDGGTRPRMESLWKENIK